MHLAHVVGAAAGRRAGAALAPVDADVRLDRRGERVDLVEVRQVGRVGVCCPAGRPNLLGDRVELYHTEGDPGETEDLAPQQPLQALLLRLDPIEDLEEYARLREVELDKIVLPLEEEALSQFLARAGACELDLYVPIRL